LKIVLFGGQGQLGWELQRSLAPLGDLRAVDRDVLDLADREGLARFLKAESPGLIVNASAYTAVDQAEREPDLANQINQQAPALMAEAACALKAGFIHFSTDYVFNGELGRPYVESDEPDPLNAYGNSKLLGERAVLQAGGAGLILRTAWVYSMRTASFVTKVMAWARREAELRIVTDQISNPTWARMLAETTALLAARAGADVYGFFERHAGLYHLAGRGYASRFEWAEKILAADPKRDEHRARLVQPASTSEFPAPARRPFFSALDCTLFEETFALCLPGWERALEMALESG
jgi:dTDP-4-dehydrorhamnose reductase